MNKKITAYIVVFGDITKVLVKNSTPKGIRDVDGVFYQEGKVYSDYETPCEYRTQRITYHLSTAKKIANRQVNLAIKNYESKIDSIFKNKMKVYEKRHLTN